MSSRPTLPISYGTVFAVVVHGRLFISGSLSMGPLWACPERQVIFSQVYSSRPFSAGSLMIFACRIDVIQPDY